MLLARPAIEVRLTANSLMNSTLPARIFTAVDLIVVLFQLALAAGAPWGQVAMGGQYPGTFPPALRVAAVVQAAVLLFLAAIVNVRAGLVWPRRFAATRMGIWFVVAFSCVATVLNLITRSVWERRLWAPAAILMLASSLAVAVLPRRDEVPGGVKPNA
jgi:hypothetical protein